MFVWFRQFSRFSFTRPEMADSGLKRNIPIKLGDFSVIDTEFSSIRERFDAEMRKMEEEMSKFRSELMNRESNNFFKSSTRYLSISFVLNIRNVRHFEQVLVQTSVNHVVIVKYPRSLLRNLTRIGTGLFYRVNIFIRFALQFWMRRWGCRPCIPKRESWIIEIGGFAIRPGDLGGFHESSYIQKALFGIVPRNGINCRHLTRLHLKRAAIRKPDGWCHK